MKTAEQENQENTKPCWLDAKIPCVQYPDDDCACDPCEQCEIVLQHIRKIKKELTGS